MHLDGRHATGSPRASTPRSVRARSSASTTRPRRRRSSTSRRSPPRATSLRRSSRDTRSAPTRRPRSTSVPRSWTCSDVGVHVRVLRGSLDIVGLQQSGPTVSYQHGRHRRRDLGALPARHDGEQRDRADPLLQSRTDVGQRHARRHVGAVSRPEPDADRRRPTAAPSRRSRRTRPSRRRATRACR